MAKAKPLPPVEVLREYFSYDPETGIVERIKANKYRPNALGPVGSVQACGGLYVKFQGSQLKLHRLAWKLITGVEPPRYIDHKNGDPSDNRWSNLRAATHQGNMANCLRPGKYLPGVKWHNGLWQAQATSRSCRKYLGSFDTEQKAHDAFVNWHRDYYGEFSVYARRVS